MRGYGCTVAADSLHNVVHLSIYVQINARLQMQAMTMCGNINYLTPGEIRQVGDASTRPTVGRDRTWEYLRQRAGCADI
jgi:HCOMODA/2-hydroxy-3-carboxy-muconic semialdehyde decarboxylase